MTQKIRSLAPSASNRRWWTLGAMCFALFMIMLDNTVVNVALPSIQRDLHTSLSALEWTINAYTLTFAVLLVTGGRLGDIFGRRRMFLFGVITFGLSSAAIGFSPSDTWLIAGRAIQGIGAAFMMPATLSIISNAFPAHERGRAIGTSSRRQRSWAGNALEMIDERCGHHERGADALDDAAGDEPGVARGEADRRAREPEGDDAEQEHPAAAEDVAQPAAGDQQHGEGQGVRVDGPLERREARVEVALDRGQRDVHDRVVEHDHEQREAHSVHQRRLDALFYGSGSSGSSRGPLGDASGDLCTRHDGRERAGKVLLLLGGQGCDEGLDAGKARRAQAGDDRFAGLGDGDLFWPSSSSSRRTTQCRGEYAGVDGAGSAAKRRRQVLGEVLEQLLAVARRAPSAA